MSGYHFVWAQIVEYKHTCVTLHGWIKEAAHSLIKEARLVQLTLVTWTVQDIWNIAIWNGIYAWSRKTRKEVCVLPVQHSIEACANLLGVLYIQQTFEQLQSHTESSNATNTLELGTILSITDLGTHVYMHVRCVKKFFCLVWAQKFTVLYSWLMIQPQQLSSIWTEKPTKHICMMSRMATINLV